MKEKDYIVKDDMICPITKSHCDDECCPVGATCNMSALNDAIESGEVSLECEPKKEVRAENLVDDFVKKWREKNNTEDAVYAAYHYDAMIAFAEYFKEISK